MLDLSSYFSVPQAARELSVHPETVRRLLRQGVLPGSKVGTLWFIHERDLRRFKDAYDPLTGRRIQPEEGEHDRTAHTADQAPGVAAQDPA